MTTRQLNFKALPQLAITDGATTPMLDVSAKGSFAYSTTLDKVLMWDGIKWSSAGLKGDKGDQGEPGTQGLNGLDGIITLANKQISYWTPLGNGTVANTMGMAAPVTVGTLTARNVVTTNTLTRASRLGHVSATTASSIAGHYRTVAQHTTGNGSNLGGFVYSCVFAATDTTNIVGAQMFVGLSNLLTAPVSSTNLATLTNSIGLVQLPETPNQLFFVCSGSSTNTPINLGANFPIFNGTPSATNGVLYQLILRSHSNQNAVIFYEIKRLGTTFIASGTLTQNDSVGKPPLSNILLAHRAYRVSGASSTSSVGIDIANVYFEKEY